MISWALHFVLVYADVGSFHSVNYISRYFRSIMARSNTLPTTQSSQHYQNCCVNWICPFTASQFCCAMIKFSFETSNQMYASVPRTKKNIHTQSTANSNHIFYRFFNFQNGSPVRFKKTEKNLQANEITCGLINAVPSMWISQAELILLIMK